MTKESNDESVTFTVSKSTLMFVLGIGIGVVFALIVGAVAFDGINLTGTTNGEENVVTPSERIDIDLSDFPLLGNEDAEVVMLEFSDYTCPFCGRHHAETLPTIDENLIQAGEIRYSVVDFPGTTGRTQDAIRAAQSTHCVRDQLGNEGYYNLIEIIFENQGAISESNLREWARDVGADGEEFDQCLEEERFEDTINGFQSIGRSGGVSGTPGFLIGTEENGFGLVSGACPYDTFETIINLEQEGNDWTVNRCQVTEL